MGSDATAFGSDATQYNLGIIFASGQGVPKDERQAADWYRLAAEQGIGPAQVNLGHLYEFGQGVPKDERKAAAWYRMAAEQGDPVAQYNLGNMYANGRGVPKDDGNALAWFRKAAEQGQPNARNAVSQIEKRNASASVAAPPRSNSAQQTRHWQTFKDANGEITQADTSSIRQDVHDGKITGAEVTVYIPLPYFPEYDPRLIRREWFSCQGVFFDITNGSNYSVSEALLVTPNSATAKIEALVCGR